MAKPDPTPYLSAHENDLLTRALNSNKPTALSTTNINMNSMDFKGSPVQQTPGSGTLGSFNESPFMDDYYDFDIDGQFDFDGATDVLQGQMIGKLPDSSASPEGEDLTRDKRSHPGDDEEEEEGGGGKRREGEDKTSKKPGRKPLTSEPTSKRKAQNRAAQRAFRERKEKHLKDLELKVQDLEKASESASNENTLLKAQIEKLTMELREYKKRLSLNSRNGTLTGALPPYLAGKGFGSSLNQPNGVNFQFEFPKFGNLPGPPVLNNGTFSADQRNGTSMSAASYQVPGVLDRQTTSPIDQFTGRSNSASTDKSPGQLNSADMSSFSGLFSPSVLQDATKDIFDSSVQVTRSNGSRSSTDQNSSCQSTSYNSPTDSSNSHNEPSSSCGTSPEPSTHSPNMSKPLDNTLGKGSEETPNGELSFCEKLNMACGNPNNPIPQTMSKHRGTSDNTSVATPNFDFDIFAQQNGGHFDPVLFGDYRDPHDNYLLNGDITDGLFNDPSFTLDGIQSPPFNAAASPASKVDLLKEIDAKQNADDEEVVPADTAKMLTCSNIWEQLQTCPQVQDEGFDLNDLCTKLQRQAKCSETGAVVDEKDFKAIMKEYAKSDGSQALDTFTRDALGRKINFGTTSN